MTSRVIEAARSMLVTTRSFGSGDADPNWFLRGAGLEVVRTNLGALAGALGEAWVVGRPS